MKRITFILVLSLLFFNTIFSQEISKSVTGWVMNSKKMPIESATISLKKASDSSLVKITVSNPNGKFDFSGLAHGKYFMAITSLNIEVTYSPIFEISPLNSSKTIDTIYATELENKLKSVTVSSKKPLVEQKSDRMILNVEASVTNIGSTALEVLEKSPGVSIDKDGNISLKGKPNVFVMIDGKPSYLNGGDLANMLGNMSASQLSQIEIMTNPGAKYDASGNAGVINIKTKKSLTMGFNGNLSLSYGQGFYPKTTNNLMLNYRTDKINAFLNYGYTNNKSKMEVNVVRNFFDANAVKQSQLDQFSNLINQSQNNNLKFGIDYYLNPKTTIGFVAAGFIAPQDQIGLTNSFLKDGTGNIISIEKTNKTANNTWSNKTLNFNFHNSTSAVENSINLDYLNYDFSGNQNVVGNSYDSADQFINSNIIKNILPLNIEVFAGKYDNSYNLNNSLKIESGFKSSFVKTNNTTLYYNTLNNQDLFNENLSTKFKYNENVNAAYFNVNKKWDKWSLQIGLRVENTNYTGDQYSYANKKDSTFSRNYTNLFPTSLLTYEVNDNNELNLSIGRRIDRPAYQQLNPFISIMDKYMVMAGNPYLQPQMSNNIELSYTYKNRFTTTLNYGVIYDMINETMTHKDSIIIRSMGNIGTRYNWGISESATIPFTKWYTGVFFVNLFNNKYDGNVNGESLKLSQFTMMANINNQFSFKNGWTAELSGSYTTWNRDEGQAISLPFGYLSMGVSKNLLQNKASIKFSIRDIFHTQTPKEIQNFQDVSSTLERIRDTRVINIAFVYRFGVQQKSKNAQQSDEQKRIQLN